MSAKKVINRIASYRQTLGDMTQEGLAIRVGTSQQQISRIENGQQTSIAMARAIAEALGQPLGAVFPEIGEDASSDESGISFQDRAKKAGVRFDGEPVNWQLKFRIRGITEPFVYVIEHAEAEHVHIRMEDQLDKAQRTLDNKIFEPRFLAINPQGRFVAIKMDAIVSVSFGEWDQACELDESFASTRVFCRDTTDPIVIDDVDNLRDDTWNPPLPPWPTDEQYENWDRWKRVLVDSPVAYQFIEIHDFTDDEDIFFNIADIVLVEAPTRNLIDELFREERNAHHAAEQEEFQIMMGISLEDYLAQRKASGKPPAEFDREYQERRRTEKESDHEG